jgi:hypothetical protein
MIKKIGLSAAAILAVVALAKPPAVMAADRDDYGRDARESRDYRDYRNDHDYHRDRDYRRHERREHEDRDRDWR